MKVPEDNERGCWRKTSVENGTGAMAWKSGQKEKGGRPETKERKGRRKAEAKKDQWEAKWEPKEQ